MASDKIGSNPSAASDVVGQGDFGVQADDNGPDRAYVSREIRSHDPGKAQPRSGTESRTSGVGGTEGGRGSSSGGDVDPDDPAVEGFGSNTGGGSVGDPQPAVPAGARPVLHPPVVDPDPARAGHRDSASSDSAADVRNEKFVDDDAAKGDLTADEATGASS